MVNLRPATQRNIFFSSLTGINPPFSGRPFPLRREIFSFIQSENLLKSSVTVCSSAVLQYVMSTKSITVLEEADHKKCIEYSKTFISHLFKKYRDKKKSPEGFIEAEQIWLQKEFQIPLPEIQVPTNSRQGRPEKEFQECGNRAKKRKIQNLMDRSAEELSFAVESKLRLEGKRSQAEVVKRVVECSPRTLKKLKNPESPNMIKPYTSEEALALITDLKLTKHQYKQLQRSAKERNANIYPAYNNILEVKKECYPISNFLTITETLCEVKLQPLLDLTLQRLSAAHFETFENQLQDGDTLECSWKWGSDGSGGHSRYKQNFLINPEARDTDIVLTCIVPLEIRKIGSCPQNIWMNSRTSSPRYCRPVRFEFAKENIETITREFNRMEAEINCLEATRVSFKDKTVSVNHTLFKTMVDGKTCNAVMENRASSVCYICKASPKDMNNLELCLQKPPDTTAYSYGLQTLHSHIRFMEALLHISYKIENESWQARGAEEKLAVKNRKEFLQNELRSQLGILVDFPKQGGGNTNDGNTARRFFKNPAKTAEIIGLDPKLVERFSIVLKTLTSGLKIDTYKFRSYCLDTAKLFVSKYNWYKMPVSVHKILLHGADVIESFPIPIGQLSEDVLEARQKDYRTFRSGFSRKMSRIATNTDVLHSMFISSDPKISEFRHLPTQEHKIPPPEVMEMILNDL